MFAIINCQIIFFNISFSFLAGGGHDFIKQTKINELSRPKFYVTLIEFSSRNCLESAVSSGYAVFTVCCVDAVLAYLVFVSLFGRYIS